jgi:hypothetical protein
MRAKEIQFYKCLTHIMQSRHHTFYTGASILARRKAVVIGKGATAGARASVVLRELQALFLDQNSLRICRGKGSDQ